MPRELVLQDGVLSAVVRSFEPVEMAQIEAELRDREANTQTALTALGSVSDSELEALAVAARQHAEAKAALEDTKSELSVAQSLVATLPQPEPAATPESAEGAEAEGVVQQGEGEDSEY